jgi:sec-independent protein translocase protein TatC
MSEQNGPAYPVPAGSVPRSTEASATESESSSENQELQTSVTADTETAAETTTEVAAPPLSPTSVEVGGGGSSRRPPGFGGDDGGSGGGGDGDEEEMVKMSFLDHLVELRQRIIRILIAIGVGFFACFGFAQEILDYLSQPAYLALRSHHQEEKLIYLHPTDIFNIYLQIGLICGLILVLPYVAAQVWGFISPGLYKREKKYAVPFVLVCTALFLTGAGFGYYIALPFALKFLLGLGGPHVLPMIAVEEYLSLFTVLILGLGLIFEMPILIVILTALHIVTPKFLLDNFRYAILVITILAAVITPTTDIPNMMLFAIPMVGLYLLGVLFSKIVVSRREKHKQE